MLKRNQVYLRNAGKNYSKALQEHIAAYQKYYHRVSLDLGYTSQADKPTDVRVKEFAVSDDPQLISLYFQYMSLSAHIFFTAWKAACEFTGDLE